MAVTYEKLMSLKLDGAAFEYSERDTMLYALSIGMGRDPLDAGADSGTEVRTQARRLALRMWPARIATSHPNKLPSS